MNTLEAIEAVCDKRHSRLMASGKGEQAASQLVSEYLEHLLKVWHKSAEVTGFIKALKQGYSINLN